MSNPWSVLAVLFTVRFTMGFQFQSVAALSPFMMESYGVGLGEIGLLIGLYLSPGIFFALPGGAIANRFGDKQVVACAMVLMLLGGLVIALIPVWEAQVAGRTLSGIGGVILNVLMTKMVADWFAGRNLATAMGIFVNSWPIGIAAALLVLPFIAGGIGLSMTMGLVAALVALGLALLVFGYQPRPRKAPAATAVPSRLRGAELACVMLAGAMWGLYNAALGMVFGFGPAMLAERGWTPAAASSATSIVLWLAAVSIPLGGFLADRLRHRDLVLALGLLSFAVLMLLVPATDRTVPLFVALGLAAGIAAGPIMSLPAGVLQPGTRALGMGLFFTLFYLAIFIAPMAAGALAEAGWGAEVAFTLGGAMLLACLGLLVPFRALSQRTARLAQAA